jgi:DNA-binding transcriptional LysR family regulator
MSLLSPQLQAFVAVARRQTVQQAAGDLRLTQTGVTQRILTLEKSLGATLFTRSRKGMRLTPEGEALLRYCQSALELEGEALARIAGGSAQSVVRLALCGPSSIMRSRVIPAALSILAGHPSLRLTFDIADDHGGLAKLKSGDTQLAVLPRELVAREMDSKVLAPERYVLVVPAAWRRRAVADVVANEAIVDFDTADEMTLAYLREHDLAGLVRSERHFANNTDALAAMVVAGCGYSVLVDEFARPLVEAGALAVLSPTKALRVAQALAWYPRPEMPAYFKALVRAVR